ncbi:MAG: hypothetical protein JST16_12415 [Bdellovibrionales bacterium]|nr:hypothetical protein [Bdellovibrionales bacterium]
MYAFRFVALASLLGTVSCTQLAQVPLREEEPVSPQLSVQVPEGFTQASAHLEEYLKGRHRLQSRFVPAGAEGKELRLNQPWIRDTSLRYFAIENGDRKRHIVEWKGQWILTAESATQTNLRLSIVEVLYLGLPEMADDELSLEGDWFETQRDGLRGGLEMRRFWAETYAAPVPAKLAELNAPNSWGPPLSKALLDRGWQPLRRTRSF